MRRRTWLVLCAVFALYAWFVHFWPTFHAANESIRLYFVQAVVDHGSASVDPVMEEYRNGNCDRAEYQGRSYLDKAPGLSFAVMPAYWALTRVFGMSTDFPDLPRLSHLLLLFGVAFPAVIGVWLVRRIVLDWTGDERAAWTAALVLGLATPYALYATLFFGHTPAAVLGIASFYLLLRERPGLAGAMAGGMVLVDTATAMLALVLGMYAGLRRRRPEDLLWFGLGGIPFVGVQLAYNTVLFDDPLSFAYRYKASSDLAAIHEQGVFGFSIPSWDAVLGLTAGAYRGLFFHAPVLLAGLVGLAPDKGAEAPVERRRDRRALAAVLLVYFLWIAAFVDWPAGASYAPRHLVVLTPFLAVGVGLAVARPAVWRWLRWVLPGLALASFAVTWAMIATFPYAPGSLDAPVAQLAFPMLFEGHLAPSLGDRWGVLPGAWSLLAVAALTAAILVALRVPLRLLGVGLAGLALVWAIASVRPEETRKSLGSRAFVECLMDHPETGRGICEEHGGRWVDRACACRWPR